jgi:hypothetical protein
MLRIIEDTLRAVTPHVLGVDAVDWLPECDPQESVDFLREWTQVGIPEFGHITTLALFFLNLYSLVSMHRLFPNLDFRSQDRLMQTLFALKGMLGFLFSYFLGTAAVSTYYSRVDVQVALGFDIPSLKEEAERRHVTRREEPTDEQTAAKPSGGSEGT